MTVYKYSDIVKKSKEIKKNVANNYELGVTPRWCYYICKALINPKQKDINGINITDASKPNGDYISRQIFKSSYIYLAINLRQKIF